MSKRWKVRKANAEKREKSQQIIDDFYSNVIRLLKEQLEKTKQQIAAKHKEPMT